MASADCSALSTRDYRALPW